MRSRALHRVPWPSPRSAGAPERRYRPRGESPSPGHEQVVVGEPCARNPKAHSPGRGQAEAAELKHEKDAVAGPAAEKRDVRDEQLDV